MADRCRLCWAEFESPVALLLHEAEEDDRLYEVEQPPSLSRHSMSSNSGTVHSRDLGPDSTTGGLAR